MEEGSHAQYRITNLFLVEGKSRSRYIDALVGQFSCEFSSTVYSMNILSTNFALNIIPEAIRLGGRKKRLIVIVII